MKALLLIAMVLAGASGSLACSADALLKPGDKAPDVVGEAADGHTVRLSEQRGRPAVVYFYPKDDTPGCTKEACAFRDAFDRYTKLGITIFGISRDDPESHRAFRKKYELPFPLVPDDDGKIQKAYGVPGTLFASRVTFLIGADGKIAHVWPDVDPGVHADQVLAKAQTLLKDPS